MSWVRLLLSMEGYPFDLSCILYLFRLKGRDEIMKVVVTGIGVLTSVGIGKAAGLKAFFSGQDGVGTVTRFDTHKLKINKGFEIKEALPSVGRDTTRLVQLAYHAAMEALQESGLNTEDEGMCLLVGSGLGDEEFINNIAKGTELNGEPFLYHRLGPQLARLLGLSGGVIGNGTACSAALNSIAYGFDLIRNRECEAVIAGGAETFSLNSMAYFDRVTIGKPEKIMPFDKMREGILLGEGGGFVVLESMEKVQMRHHYGEILGYGLSCDAFHISNMSVDGVAKAMARALINARVNPVEIDYIVAHGTGTPINDLVETEAIKRVFNRHAYSIPISSVKSMIGHTGGASGAIGLISGLFAIAEQKLPPTINYKNPDPECDLDYVPNIARSWKVKKVLVNSFGFGGANCSMVIGA